MRLKSWVLVAVAVLTSSSIADGAKAEGGDRIKTAYKREFAFLQAEKSTLKSRIGELEQEHAGKLSSARGQIDSLQGSIMRATVESERLSQMLYEAERSVEGIEEGTDAVERTLEQANALLEKHGVALPEQAQTEDERAAMLAQLDAAFDGALGILESSNSVRTQDARYFDTAGKQVEGRVLYIGNVAAYGLASGAEGALAPAGADRLKLWGEPASAQTAQALTSERGPATLGIFLYESLDNSVDRKTEKTALQVIESGGAIAWVIVALGLAALLMIILRALMLMRSSANTGKLVERLTPLLERGAVSEAIALCRQSKSAAGRVLRATLENLDREREHLEDIISESILHETPHLDRFGSAILVMAAVAPLLGLLGTVTGMISTFDVITEFGTGNPKLLSGGISEALVTTELGLIVAIPALLCGNMLAGWASSIKDDMDKSALRITNIAGGLRVSMRPSADAAHSEQSSSSAPVLQS